MIYLYKVSEILHNIKLTVSENFPLIDVIGEVFEVNLNNKSGHIYFSLKEERHTLLCACWKSKVEKYKPVIIEGKNVKIRGRILTFPTNGKVYLDVQDVTMYNRGDISANLEKLTIKLKNEGIFNVEHKKQLPSFPNSIGLITSKDGAVLGDITNTLQHTFPCVVQLYDVNVQGAESIPAILKALKYFQNLPKKQQPEVIIIARGGGGLDDLFHFNNEELVREIFVCQIPIISAIGHEVNSTLVDRVSDKSVVTPTASVLFLPKVADLLEDINQLQEKQTLLLKQHFNNILSNLQFCHRYLKHPVVILNYFAENLDTSNNKLNNILINNIQTLLFKTNILLVKVQVPQRVNDKINNINQLKIALNKVHDAINYRGYNLINLQRILENFSVKNTLKRGFSILSQDGQLISSVQLLRQSNKCNSYNIEFYDADIDIQLTLKDK